MKVDGGNRHGLNPRCKRSPRTLKLLAGDKKLSSPANFCSVLLWSILETTQCERMLVGNDCGVCNGLVPHASRYSDYTWSNKWICGGLISLDREQYQLPIFWYPYYNRLGYRYDWCELHNQST